MTNIRINDLPADPAPNASDVLPVDGTSTRKTTLTQAVDAGRPFASQAEAEAGTSPTKAMSPLTTAQAIAALGGPVFAPIAAGVPTGGTVNQVLGKTSGADYAMSWRNAGAGDLLSVNNLADVGNAATALGNLGGLSAALAASTYLTQASAAATYQPVGSYQPLAANLTSWGGVTRAAGFDTFAAGPSSANLKALVTDETGSGALVFATSPTLVTPALGTPSALVLTNATGLPIAGGGTNASTADGSRLNLVVPTYVTTLAALKALDTTKDTVASYDSYFWDWTLGNFSAEITADGTYATVKANAIASTVGAWVRRVQQPVQATVFGGFTGTALQAAVDYMSRKGGGEVYLPSGSANSLAAQVTVPTQVSIRGGKGSSITPTSAMTRMLLVQAGLTAVRGIRLENSGGLATRGIEVNKAFNNAKVVIEDNYFSNFTDAVRWTDGDCLHFLGNEVVSNANAVYVANNCMNSHFEKNYILGGAGYNFNKTTQGVEGANICGDIILPGSGGSPAITFNCALDVQITGCILDQLYGASGVNIIATTNAVSGVKFLNNWVGRNLTAGSANYGLYVEGGARNVQSAFNTYTGWQQAGIYFKGASGAATKDCSSIGDNFYYADRCLRDILIDWSDNLLIDGDTFNGSGASIVESAGTISGRVVNCNYTGSIKPATITGGLRYGDQRAGMVLRNKGNTTIVAAGTAVVINHGLDYTPTLQDLRLICGTVTTNGSGDLAAVTIGATQFTITPRIAPGTNMAVGWVADLTR